MHLFTLHLKQAIILLPFLLSLPINVLSSEYDRRGNTLCCVGSDCDDEVPEDITPTEDGPTSDRSAGIGVEFETFQVRFHSPNCDEDSTFACKGKRVGDREGNYREGTNWKLTADTMSDAGELTAEYILDGTAIKIGTGAAAAAAAAVAHDITLWDPSVAMDDTRVAIEGSDTCEWDIAGPAQGGGAADISWAPQVTAPLPLEAINDLFAKAVANEAFPLLPRPGRNLNPVHVTGDFFQSQPHGLSRQSATADVLGFFSLILSYAKAPKLFTENDSPKDLTTIMPRTDFTTIFAQVRTAIPHGSLYDIVKILACYRNADGGGVAIDSRFCTGTVEAPQPNGQMDTERFTVHSASRSDSCTVQEWIQSIEDGSSPDRLSRLDEVIDGSVGGLGGALENVLDTNRAVPLFEFRRLISVTLGNMQGRVIQAENAIIAYHHAFANAPRLIKKTLDTKFSHIKRRGASAYCPSSTHNASTKPTASKTTNKVAATKPAPHTTSPPPMPSCSRQFENPDEGITADACICGSTTLPLLTVPDATNESQSCSYTKLPSSHVSNPITIETQHWTSNCHACTLVGGVADVPTCTSVSGCTPTTTANPTPTFAVFLSNNSLPIGDENNKNNGSDMRAAVFSKLKALCPDDANVCDSTTHAHISEIPTVVGWGSENETLSFTIQDSHYNSPDDRDRMLAAAVASWQQAVARSCKEVTYHEIMDEYHDCSGGPVKRDLPTKTLIEKRTPILEPTPEKTCTYTATICSGPDHINPVFAGSNGAYDNHMNIQLSWELDGESAWDEFLCDAIIDGLTALAAAIAPELVGAELFGDIEFDALCADMTGHKMLQRGIENATPHLLGGF